MDSFTLKSSKLFEYNLLFDEPKDTNDVIYGGHKFGVDSIILEEIIEYRVELSTGNLFTLDYKNYYQSNQTLKKFDPSIWFCDRIENKEILFENSWGNLLKFLETERGKFKNIYIVKNYI